MTDQLPSHAVHADGSASVQEAATLLGCSEKTIRRRIKAGTLTAHQLPTSQGYEWRIHLNDTTDQAPPPPAVQLNGRADQLPGTVAQVDTQTSGYLDLQAPEPQNEALIKALELVDRLQRENMELAGRAGFLQARLQTTEEQLLALTSGQSTETPVDEVAAVPEPAWKRFLSRLRL